MIPQELLTGLAPVRRRLRRFGLLQKAGIGSLGGLVAAVFLLLVARVLPILHSDLWAAMLLLVGVFAGGLWGLLTPPTWKAAAQAVDRYGLEDRVSTALYFAERETSENPASPLVLLQRQEAIERLLQVREEVAKIVPFSVSRKKVSLGLGLLVAAILLIGWPNPLDQVALERRDVEQKAKQVAEDAKQAAEEVKKQAALSESERKRLDEAMEQLEKDLQEAKTQEELERALAKAQHRVQTIKERVAAAQTDQNKLADSLARAEAGRKLAEALRQGDAEQMRREIERLKEQVTQLREEQRKALAEAMAQAGVTNPELQQGLQEAASALKGSDTAAMSRQIGNLASMLNATSGAQAALGQLGQQLAAAAGAQSSQGSGGASGTNSGAGGRNEATQPGQGIGNGNGQGGVGRGSGAGVGRGSGAGVGAGSRELVTVPVGEFGVGESGGLGDGPLGSGASEVIDGQGQVTPGVARPYEEVYRSYSEYARESVERSDLPLREQQWVRDYFSEIAP
jgi:hypothetical protein